MDLLRPFHRLSSEGIEAALLVIGDGNLRDEAERYVTIEHLKNVRFVGFQNQRQLSKYYVCGDIFVLPAQFDTWGLVVNEAMLFGMPVIVSRGVGSAHDLVRPGVTGEIYPIGDVERLAGHLRELILFPDKRAQMGAAAADLVAQYSYTVCGDGILEALRSVTEPARRC